MYVSSIYDEIKCLTCGVYQEWSEGEANPAQKLMLFSLLFMLQDFSSCVSSKGVCILFCSDAPLFLNPLVVVVSVVVAEVETDVGEPATSQSITNALIWYKTSFKVYLSEVSCWNLSESKWKMGHWNIFTWPIKS